MRTLALSIAFTGALVGQALAWGQEGHSIVAEIAQTRLTRQAAAAVAQLLNGRSLASIASWADDVRSERRPTTNWHFVDIPVRADDYLPDRDCVNDPEKGDCVVAELDRLKNELRCASGDAKVEALKFAVHFVGDIHQPFHTVREDEGANLIEVDLFARGLTCRGSCMPAHALMTLHAAWDTDLIEKAVWDWGAYVERLESKGGWLNSAEATDGVKGTDPRDWAIEAHKYAREALDALPANNVLDDHYFDFALPIIDRQLGVAGLRLASLLNDAYASDSCPAR
jgi:hypothetical protein